MNIEFILISQEKQHQQTAIECAELRAQVHALRSEHEHSLQDVRDKEERIHHLTRELHNLVRSLYIQTKFPNIYCLASHGKTLMVSAMQKNLKPSFERTLYVHCSIHS